MANKVGLCTIDGCGKVGPLTRGWCHKHYRRYRVDGTPGEAGHRRAPSGMTQFEILDYWGFDVTPDGCHIARGWANEDGYVVYSNSGTKIKAHRTAYQRYHGEVPRGREVCHTCDVPACINPEHLYAGTHSQNMLDRARRSRIPNRVLTEDTARRVKAWISEGFTDREISGFLEGVSPDVVYTVRKGITWAWVK